MRYGLTLVSRGPAASRESLLATAREADQLGYETVWVGDHVVIPEQASSRYPYGPPGSFSVDNRQTYFEALTVLAVVAGATERVRLGTSVLIAPQREPVLTGKQLATLDALSNGRVVVGVGVGWFREEFEALGMSERFGARGEATDECIRIWKALWTEQTSRFQGEHYTLPPVRAYPKPVQRPHPPILVGGNVRASRRRAARLGDGWHAIGLTPEELRAGIAELRTFVAAAGRQPAEVAVSVRLTIRLGTPPQSPAELGGSPSEVRAQLARLEDLGVDEVCLDFADFRVPQPEAASVGMLRQFAETAGLRPRGT